MNPFLTLLKKELREIAPWALLLAALFTAALYYAGLDTNSYQPAELFGSSFNLILRFGPPLVAAALGVLITVHESKGDKWAFLIHRPFPAHLFFWAKLLAAGSLYLAITLLPLSIEMLWASRPGHIGMPFHWPMALPSLAAVLIGMAYLPTAIAITLRHHLPWPARVLPIGLPLAGTVLSIMAFEFHHAAIIAAVTFILALILALHTFSANLSTPSASTRRLGHAVTILSLLAGIWLMAWLVFIAILTVARPDLVYHHHYYKFDNQGRILRVNLVNRTSTITDMHGLSIPGMKPNPSYAEFLAMSPDYSASLFNRADYDQRLLGPRTAYSLTDRYAVRLSLDAALSDRWYFDLPSHRLMGFKAVSDFVGSFGSDGFAPPQTQSSVPFTGQFLFLTNTHRSSAVTRLVMGSGIYVLDMGRKSLVATPFLCPVDETIFAAGNAENIRTNLVLHYLVVTNKRILFFDPQSHAVILELPLPADINRAHSIGIRLIKNQYWVHFSSRTDRPIPTAPQQLLIYDADTRQLLSSTTLAPIPQTQWNLTPSYSALASLILGPAGHLLIVARADHFQEEASNYLDYRFTPSLLAPWLAASAALGFLGCLALAYKRKTPVLPTISWTLLGALLGLPGVLLMAAAAARQPLERCPACARFTPAGQPHCTACQAPLTPTAQHGSEILAPLTPGAHL